MAFYPRHDFELRKKKMQKFLNHAQTSCVQTFLGENRCALNAHDFRKIEKKVDVFFIIYRMEFFFLLGGSCFHEIVTV